VQTSQLLHPLGDAELVHRLIFVRGGGCYTFGELVNKAALDLKLTSLRKGASFESFIAADYLDAIRAALHANTWGGVEEAWLRSLPAAPKLIWNFGPIESVSDTLHGHKRFFSSILLEVSPVYASLTEAIYSHIDAFFQQLPVPGSIPPQKIRIFVGNALSWGGELKRLYVSGLSRPERVDLLEQYGSVKQIFLNNMQTKMEQLYIPLAEAVLAPGHKEQTVSFLKHNYGIALTLHEVCHTIGKFAGYRERMGAKYNLFEEARTDFLAYAFARFLEERKALPPGFTHDMLMAKMVVGLHMLHVYRSTGLRKGYADLLCFLLHTWAGAVAWQNKRMSINIQEAASRTLDRSKDMLLIAAHKDIADYESSAMPSPMIERIYEEIKKHRIPVGPATDRSSAIARNRPQEVLHRE